jgi:hypothetical protein
MSKTKNGRVRYELKPLCCDGTSHVFFTLIGKLAALVTPPRLNIIRFYGVFAPHSNLRGASTPHHAMGMGSDRNY